MTTTQSSGGFGGDDSTRSVDCDGCPVAATTACNDCVVTHVLALDDGPIPFLPRRVRENELAGDLGRSRHPSASGRRRAAASVPSAVEPVDEVAGAVERLMAAGLVTDPTFVASPVPQTAGVPA